jgi:hypothetical protein
MNKRWIIYVLLLVCFSTLLIQSPSLSGKPLPKEGFVRVDAGDVQRFSQQAEPLNIAEQDDDIDDDKLVNTDRIRQALANLEPDQVPTTNPMRVGGSPPSPDKLLAFLPDLDGVDPMIAVGHTYIIVSQDHSFAYYDKNGNLRPNTGRISTKDFFSSVINQANINFELGDAPNEVLTKCDDDQTNLTKDITEAYDTRVIYEPENRKFIILSALRNRIWHDAEDPDLCKTWAIRTFAFAISNTEDPRDGFKMWFWTKNNYRDWPRISADKDIFTVAHNGSGEEGTPTIYVISMKDMVNGMTNPRWFTYRRGVGNTPDMVLPVAKYNTPNNTTFDDYVTYMRGDGDNVVLYYFKKNSFMWNLKPALGETDIGLSNDVTFGWHERPVLRKGNIYFTNGVGVDEGEENKHPKVYGFDLYRLPLKKDGNKIEFNASSSKKMEYPVYPKVPEGTQFVSYEVPSLSVDEKGTILTAYGRLGRTKDKDIYPESRYFVFYENENKHRLSKQLRSGEFMPMFTPDGWDEKVPDGHRNYSHTKDLYIDYSTVTVDPDKRFVFWIAHSYADLKNSKYKIVVGKVFSP